MKKSYLLSLLILVAGFTIPLKECLANIHFTNNLNGQIELYFYSINHQSVAQTQNPVIRRILVQTGATKELPNAEIVDMYININTVSFPMGTMDSSKDDDYAINSILLDDTQHASYFLLNANDINRFSSSLELSVILNSITYRIYKCLGFRPANFDNENTEQPQQVPVTTTQTTSDVF